MAKGREPETKPIKGHTFKRKLDQQTADGDVFSLFLCTDGRCPKPAKVVKTFSKKGK